jgi:hypothetical protein
MSHLQAWAWFCPLGTGATAVQRLLKGETVLRDDPALHPYQIHNSARLPMEPQATAHARYLHRVALLALEAARELPPTGPDLGIFTALGGLRALWDDLSVAMLGQQTDGQELWARGLGKVHPYWMLRHLSNNAHALLTMERQAQGEGATFSGDNAGAQALCAALRAIKAGRLQQAMVVGYESLLQPEILLRGGLSGRFAEIGPGEAAVALLLGTTGAPLEVENGIVESTLQGTPAPFSIPQAMGHIGAATALAQVVGLSALGPGRWKATATGELGVHSTVILSQ